MQNKLYSSISNYRSFWFFLIHTSALGVALFEKSVEKLIEKINQRCIICLHLEK
jgi:hypothetical protein